MAKDRDDDMPRKDCSFDDNMDQNKPHSKSLETGFHLVLVVVCSIILLSNQVEREVSKSDALLKIRHSMETYRSEIDGANHKAQALGNGLQALNDLETNMALIEAETKLQVDQLLKDVEKMGVTIVNFEGNVTDTLHSVTQGFLDIQSNIVPTPGSSIQEFEQKLIPLIWSKLDALQSRLVSAFAMEGSKSSLDHTVSLSDTPKLRDVGPHDSMMDVRHWQVTRDHQPLSNPLPPDVRSDFHFRAATNEDPGTSDAVIRNLIGTGL